MTKRSEKRGRPAIRLVEVEAAVKAARTAVQDAINKHGRGSFASVHELESVVRAEADEVTKAVHRHEGHERVRAELLDVAAAAIFAVACIDANTLDW